MTGLSWIPKIDQVVISSSSSNVPYPPGSDTNAEHLSAMILFRLCMSCTCIVSIDPNPPVKLLSSILFSWELSALGITPTTFDPCMYALLATSPISPRPPPPYTRLYPAVAIDLPRRSAANEYSGSAGTLDAQNTQI
ncbi:hypothetical protein AYI70_g4823 [Smittium culicis]|uniref:Uncharacterized protein n=1 Tax=Smittium culicis TaxID=133412 RepID=A0A1R1XXJ0_9FUNG|nr:hypothetical protein AYI70_g11700 [Smittium culicis]OMJ19279.1 hypothetical protein AYI70_g4823 [Smittium culicis]